jgi:hypothetical protein
MPMSLKAARGIVATHRPVEGGPVGCPVCTRLGVGSNGAPVAWPCSPYRQAVPVLEAAGELRPPPEESPARVTAVDG